MLHVKWGRDILHFPMPSLETPLGQLRAVLANYTQLPASAFKLVYKGGVMRDNGAPLSMYKLKEGATIMLIGGDVVPEKETKERESKPGQTEEATIGAIRAELERVRARVVPDVEAFVGVLSGEAVGARPTALDHTRLSELLLQSLLRLDAMFVPGVDWPEARVQRKAAVREVQGVLDRLDGAWAAR